MGLKFRCTNCNEYIYLQFLKVGDIAECKNCSQRNVVPKDAEAITNDETSRNQQVPKAKSDQSKITPQSTNVVPNIDSDGTVESSQVNRPVFVNGMVVGGGGKEYELASRRRRYLAVVINEFLILFYAGVFVVQAFIDTFFRRKVHFLVAGLIGVALIFFAAALDHAGIIDSSFDRGISEFFIFILFLSWFFGHVGIISIVLLILVTTTNFYPLFFITLFLFGTFFGGDGALKGQGWAKKTCKIKVIHSHTGKPCTFWQSFLRKLFIYIPLIGLFDLLWALGQRKQRLGDKLAKTIVVKQGKDGIVIGDRPAYKTVNYFVLLLVVMFSSNLIFRLVFPTSVFDLNHFNGEVDTPKIVKSTDRQFQVTVPSNWRELPELHDDASLEVGSKWDELYLIVLVENKDELGNMNLESYSQLTRESIISLLESEETSQLLDVSGPVELRICDNIASFSTKIRGVFEGLGVVYLHTTAENHQNFYQILGYGSSSTFSNEKKEILQAAIQSLRKIP